MALLNLIVSHLHTSTQFWQNHYLYVFVLHPQGMIRVIGLSVGYRFNYGIGIHYSATALINSIL